MRWDRRVKEALVSRVRNQPALDASFPGDRLEADCFPGIGRLVRFLRENAGMLPSGVEPLPRESALLFDPPVPEREFKLPRPLRGR